MDDVLPIKRALVSVYDKSGLDILGAFFKSERISVVSTGGTAFHLKSAGLSEDQVVEKSPLLDGRIKTLDHRIFAGILFDRKNALHASQMMGLDIHPIDLVVVNFYPCAKTATEEGASMENIIEHIDIGGPALLRAGAKNHAHVTTLYDPNTYESFIHHYQEHRGTRLWFRQTCAKSVFSYTSAYDQSISLVLEKKFGPEPKDLTLGLREPQRLRYGENPHQKAYIYRSSLCDGDIELSLSSAITGKQLSYNNFLDIHASIWCMRCLSENQPSPKAYAIVIKHGIPCGAALDESPHGAIKKAIASDEKSAFGGIIAVSSAIDQSCMKEIKDRFFEVIVASGFSQDAISTFSKEKNLRLVPIHNLMTGHLDKKCLRSIFGGVLMQECDHSESTSDWTCVTKKKPSTNQALAMDFATRMVKSTKSNAITIASPDQLIGVGTGQPSRIQAAEIAISLALSRRPDLSDCALASDAFFPFTDCLKLAHAHGIQLIIQPGGSIRDQEIIHEANRLELSMIFTHRRHFSH